MRKLFFLLIVFIGFVGCKSNEEKAEDLIKNELYKTLYDFESYQPIETKVYMARLDENNDSTIRDEGNFFGRISEKFFKYDEEAKNAKEEMDIWGEPSYYSSTYSINKYYESKDKYRKALFNKEFYGSVLDSLSQVIKNKLDSLDTNKVIGWEVEHKFRCKTKGGYPTIANYRYVMDKDFKKIIFFDDLDDDDSEIQMVKNALMWYNYINK